MSWQAVEAVMQRSRSEGTARLVLMVIATHCQTDKLSTHIGLDKLCEEANTSKRNLIYTLAKLEASEELKIDHSRGHGVVNGYTVTLPEKVQPIAPLEDAENVQDASPLETRNVQPIAPLANKETCNPASRNVQSVVRKVQSTVRNVQPIAPIPIEPKKPKEPTLVVSSETTDEKKSASRAAQATEVFDYWKRERGKNGRTIFDNKRRRAVEARLKDGNTVEFIKQAIRGVRNSPHHMGENAQKQIFDDLELICRDQSKLERFAALDEPKAKARAQPDAEPKPCRTCNDSGTETVCDPAQDWKEMTIPCRTCRGTAGVEYGRRRISAV